MKKFQCPLCGTVLQFFHELKFGGLGRVGCSSCEWVTFLASPPQAWKAAEKYISGFPPIMRVWPGDEVLCGSRPSPVTIVSKNIECGEIKIRDCHRTYFIIDCDDVLAWPWEFEQKGGSND